MKGDRNSAKFDLNPSLSAKHKEKGDKFYLIAFFYCGLQRPAAGGEGCRNEGSTENPG